MYFKLGFESLGFTDVATFIQSGNVLFKTDEQDKAKLVDLIEKKLSERFNYNSKIVLITQKQLETVVKKAPEGFGIAPDEYRYDVIFLKDPLVSKEAIKSVKVREGVDRALSFISPAL